MMDPYVSLLLNAMDSKFTSSITYAVKVKHQFILFICHHINVVSFCLFCFFQAFVVIIEMKNVPSVAVMIERIVTKVFSLLLVSSHPATII